MDYINAALNMDELADAADVVGVDRNELETIKAVMVTEAILSPETKDQLGLTDQTMDMLNSLLMPTSVCTREIIFAIAEKFKTLAVTGTESKYCTFCTCKNDSKS